MASCVRRHLLTGLLGITLLATSLTGCAPTEVDDDDWDWSQETEEIAVAGRWMPSAAATAAGNRHTLRYDDAPSWSGGRYCGGSLLAGTRELGDYLRANFRGVRAYDGYACRQNTANTSRTSMHGTGRALDVYIPLSNGQADNTLGDAVANWLIANAGPLGVQLVIWDRSMWNASNGAGAKLRGYGGPHPHHDHLHIELNTDGAARRTAWFRDRNTASSPGSFAPSAPSAPSTPSTPSTGPRLRVTAQGLNLRTGPGTGYGVITSMWCGTAVTVVSGPTSGWYRVIHGTVVGWAAASYLTPEASFNAAVCR